jgi:hypothetical protein
VYGYLQWKRENCWIEPKELLDSIFFIHIPYPVLEFGPLPQVMYGQIVRVTFLSRMSGASDILQVPRMVVSAPLTAARTVVAEEGNRAPHSRARRAPASRRLAARPVPARSRIPPPRVRSRFDILMLITP